MAQAILATIVVLIIIILLLSVLLWLQTWGGSNAARRQRNRMYPVRLFQYAYPIPELHQYLAELADEGVAILFPAGRTHGNHHEAIAGEDVEKICIVHCQNLGNDLEIETLASNNPPPAALADRNPQALLYLLRQYLADSLSANGIAFVHHLFEVYGERAYRVLVFLAAGNKDVYAKIYPDAFFEKIKSLEQLEKYPGAAEYLLESYRHNKLGASGRALLSSFMAQRNPKIYQMLIATLPQADFKSLQPIYSDDFFEKIANLAELQKFPQALPFVLRGYLSNRAGKHAKLLVERLASESGQEIYQQLFRLIYKGNNKEFALQMIQGYAHLSNDIKIAILRCQQGDRYVDASIKKLSQQQGGNGWEPLFVTVGQILGATVAVPQSVNEVRKVKKLVEFHRDGANSAGNMLKVLDLEKILENLDEFQEWLQGTQTKG